MMKITDVETFIAGNPWKNWLFVRVETDEGIYGIGEGTLNGLAKTVEACIHDLSDLIIDQDPFDIEKMRLELLRDVYSDGGQIQGSAHSALETACWDIIGKVTDQPLYKLLGGRCHERLRCYANGWYQGGRTPENFAERAQAVVDKGYTALKFDPFGAAWRTVRRSDFDLAVEIIAAVREQVGDEIDLLIEGHNRFSAATALQFARAIEPFKPTWFETPVPPHPISSIIRVAEESPVPVICGEDYYRREQFTELFRHDVVHIVNVEPQYVGLSGARQVCAMADAHNAVAAPHSAQGPISTVATAHLNTATPNFFLHEMFTEFNEPWEEKLIDPPLEIEGGYVRPPTGPGLGIELNLEEIEKHPYHSQNWLPLFKEGWESREGNR